MSSGYEDQYERLKRWFLRVEDVEDGLKNQEFDAAKFKDDYLAFFQNCYHLKDHLLNDSAANVTESDLDSFIATTSCMSICADICNGTKHLTLNGSGWSGENPEMADGAIVTDNIATGVVSASYSVHTDTGEKDAFELAKNCMDAWETFMKKHNLL